MLKHIFRVLTIVVILGALPFVSSAQGTSSNTYTGINLLFIVDQSGSMGGKRYDGPDIYGDGNDLYDLRFAGPQYALNWLSDLRGSVVDVNKPDIRFAVLAFGSYTRVMQDWKTLNTDSPDWQTKEMPTVLESISSKRFEGRNLGLTDFETAFNDAESGFFRSPPPPAPGKKYLNVIITLTDGAPCTSGDYTLAADGTKIYQCNAVTPASQPAMEKHLEQLRSIARNSFGSSDYELYVIGLDVKNDFWNSLKGFWANIVCKDKNAQNCTEAVRYNRVDASEKIGSQLRLILGDAVNLVAPNLLTSIYDSPTVPATFQVKPYQQFLRVDIFKVSPSPAGTLSLTSPRGSVTPSSDSGDDTTIRTLRQENPTAGSWTMGVSNPSQVGRVVAQTVPAGIHMDSIKDGEILSQIPLKTQLVRGDNSPLAVVSGSPDLIVEARIYDAQLVDRNQRPLMETIPLPRDTSRGDMYQFLGAWIPETPGKYEVRVRATYSGGTLIDEQTMQDNVIIAGATVQWKGITPSSERTGRQFTGHGSIVTQKSSTPVNNVNSLVTHTIITRNNGTPVSEFDSPNAGTQPGEITIQFTLDQPGNYFVRMAVGKDKTGQFTVIGDPSDAIPITVRPIRPLTLSIMQPAAPEMESQSVSLSPAQVSLVTPVTVQVGLRDEFSGTWVSLADVTGGAETKPTLNLKSNGDSNGQALNLVEVQPGIYAVDVPNLWPGNYVFTANVTTPNDALMGDYAWQSTTVSQTLIRIWSGSFILASVILAVVVIGSIILVIFIILHDRRRREFPLHGSINVVMRPADPRMPGATELATFNLDSKTRNRQVFNQKQLPKPFENLYLVVSTQRTEHNSENGYAVIEKLKVNGRDSEKVGRVLRPDGEPTIIATSEDGENELVLTKDVSLTAAFDFLTAAKTK